MGKLGVCSQCLCSCSKGESAMCTTGFITNHYLKLLKSLYSCPRFSRYIYNFFSFFLSLLCWEFEWGIFFLLVFFSLVLITVTPDLIPCHYIWAKKPNVIIRNILFMVSKPHALFGLYITSVHRSICNNCSEVNTGPQLSWFFTCKGVWRTDKSVTTGEEGISYDFQTKSKASLYFCGLSRQLLQAPWQNYSVCLHYSAYLVKWISASYRKGIDKVTWLSESCCSLLSLFIKTHLSQVL